MVRVSQNSPHPPIGPLGLNPAVAGTVCCALSALGYAATSVCIRKMAALEIDPMWATCNKEAVTVFAAMPWLAWQASHGRLRIPSAGILVRLISVGLVVQLGANLGVQWAMGVVGLAIVVPAIFGVMVTTSAVFARILLKETVSPRTTMAITLLLISLGLLALAARVSGESLPDQSTPSSLMVTLAVLTACVAGAIYSILTITLRYAVTQGTPMSIIVFLITVPAVITLGPISIARFGIEHLLATPGQHWAWMYLAGTLNFLGFLAITKGLQWTTVVHANVLNASQVAMAAVAGWLLFQEPLTPWLIAGITLTIVGVILVGRPTNDIRLADQHA